MFQFQCHKKYCQSRNKSWQTFANQTLSWYFKSIYKLFFLRSQNPSRHTFFEKIQIFHFFYQFSFPSCWIILEILLFRFIFQSAFQDFLSNCGREYQSQIHLSSKYFHALTLSEITCEKTILRSVISCPSWRCGSVLGNKHYFTGFSEEFRRVWGKRTK